MRHFGAVTDEPTRRSKRKCKQSSARLLRVGDAHHDIGFSRSRGDGAVFVKAKINIAQASADLVGGATECL